MYKVKKPFTDRDTGTPYQAGDTYTGTEVRVSELQDAGYLAKTEVPDPAPPPKGKRASTDE